MKSSQLRLGGQAGRAAAAHPPRAGGKPLPLQPRGQAPEQSRWDGPEKPAGGPGTAAVCAPPRASGPPGATGAQTSFPMGKVQQDGLQAATCVGSTMPLNKLPGALRAALRDWGAKDLGGGSQASFI